MRADAARNNREPAEHRGAPSSRRTPRRPSRPSPPRGRSGSPTVYRRFESRGSLLAAVYEARLDAVGGHPRSPADEAPVAVALHRYAGGHHQGETAPWPVELQRMRADLTIRDRRAEFSARSPRFVQRATDEGLCSRDDLPRAGSIRSCGTSFTSPRIRVPRHEPAQAADFAVKAVARSRTGVGAAQRVRLLAGTTR